MADNAFPSLSDFHDYEPNLEFDDSWIQSAMSPLPPELGLDADDDVLPRSSSDGTIEENFERELASPPRSYAEIEGEPEHFDQLVRSGLIEVAGNDAQGRLILVISACRLPATRDVAPESLLKFLMFTLDKFVEQDYSILYLHHGITSENKPPFTWFWDAYSVMDRKYKKNLKALYIVHPTMMVRVLLNMFKPIISMKFSKKLKIINYIHELEKFFTLNQIPIPECVREYDQRLLAKNPRAAKAALAAGEASTSSAASSSSSVASASCLLPALPVTESPQKPHRQPTQQFGVSLEFIREHNPDMQDNVPPIVRYCVDFLSKPECLATEGVFRRSTSHVTLTQMVSQCNSGEQVDFNNDPHCAAVLLKTFLKDLEEPILTHRLYNEIVEFNSWPMCQRPRMTKILLLEKLPLENYKLLKYVVQFLWRVADMSCLNKMTASNLAVVFGPNLLWPPHVFPGVLPSGGVERSVPLVLCPKHHASADLSLGTQ